MSSAFLSGRSAAWLARLLWEQEVRSSNLRAPTVGKFLLSRNFEDLKEAGFYENGSNGVTKTKSTSENVPISSPGFTEMIRGKSMLTCAKWSTR